MFQHITLSTIRQNSQCVITNNTTCSYLENAFSNTILFSLIEVPLKQVNDKAILIIPTLCNNNKHMINILISMILSLGHLPTRQFIDKHDAGFNSLYEDLLSQIDSDRWGELLFQRTLNHEFWDRMHRQNCIIKFRVNFRRFSFAKM